MVTTPGYSSEELRSTGTPPSYEGDHLSEIAFPLGGIGTGCVSLSGLGELVDWEIFNRPNKGTRLPYTFVSLWVQPEGGEALALKLAALLEHHPVRLVHPIARERWIVRLNAGGEVVGRRKSPKRGRVEHVFAELVRFPALIHHPRFSLEVLLTREEEVRCDDGRGSWRRKGWSIVDRRLIAVDERIRLESAGDLRALLPAGLPHPFTTQDLAEGLGVPRRLAQQMAYCLREMGVIAVVGKRGGSLLYDRCGSA